MGSVKFSDELSTHLLTRDRDVIHVRSADQALAIVARIEAEDPDGYQDWIRSEALGHEADDPAAARARIVDALARGEVVLLKESELPRVLDAPKIRWPDDPARPDDPKVIVTATWISIEVVAEDGVRIPGLGITMTYPNGKTTSGRLDDASRWRTDDIPEPGTCSLRLDKIAIDWTQRPVAAAAPGEWFDALARDPISLATGRHHRLVAVAARTQIHLVDAVGKPVANAQCRARVGDRDTPCRTDDAGMCFVVHPRAATSCIVTFERYDASVVSRA